MDGIVSVAQNQGERQMFELNDDFNKKIISRHKTMGTAAKAMNRHKNAVTRNNGSNSYIPYSLTEDGKDITEDQSNEWEEVQFNLWYN